MKLLRETLKTAIVRRANDDRRKLVILFPDAVLAPDFLRVSNANAGNLRNALTSQVGIFAGCFDDKQSLGRHCLTAKAAKPANRANPIFVTANDCGDLPAAKIGARLGKLNDLSSLANAGGAFRDAQPPRDVIDCAGAAPYRAAMDFSGSPEA